MDTASHKKAPYVIAIIVAVTVAIGIALLVRWAGDSVPADSADVTARI